MKTGTDNRGLGWGILRRQCYSSWQDRNQVVEVGHKKGPPLDGGSGTHILEVPEGHELDDVTGCGHPFGAAQGTIVAIQQPHVRKISVAHAHNDDGHGQARGTHNGRAGLSHVAHHTVCEDQQYRVFLGSRNGGRRGWLWVLGQGLFPKFGPWPGATPLPPRACWAACLLTGLLTVAWPVLCSRWAGPATRLMMGATLVGP